MSTVSLYEFLSIDWRPAFVLLRAEKHSSDFDPPVQHTDLTIEYSNPALLNASGLLDVVRSELDAGPFRKWALSGLRSTFTVASYLWTACALDDRWTIVSGTALESKDCDSAGILLVEPPPTDAPSCSFDLQTAPHGKLAPRLLDRPLRHSSSQILAHKVLEHVPLRHFDPNAYPAAHDKDAGVVLPILSSLEVERVEVHKASVTSTPHKGGHHDWTGLEEPLHLSKHVELARKLDWSRTPLGPRTMWSERLRMAANMVMADTHAAVLFWGDEGVMIYNELYIPLIEAYHPQCLGSSVFSSLKEFKDRISPIFGHGRCTGETVHQEDVPMFLTRNGKLEECFFSIKLMPILGENGTVVGHYETINETTMKIVTDRRLATFIETGVSTAMARSLDDFWRLGMQSLKANDKDMPFALIYGIEDKGCTTPMPMTCASTNLAGRAAVLKSCLGVPIDHPAAPQRLCLELDTEGYAPFFRRAVRSGQLVVLHIEDGSLPHHLVEGLPSGGRGFGDQCSSVAISAITPTGSSKVVGFFVVGFNPRQPVDAAAVSFVQATSRLLATSMASVVLMEEEVGKRQAMIEQSAVVQADMAKQLRVHQQLAEVQERRLQRFAERADVGIFIADALGNFTYHNEKYVDIITPDDPIDAKPDANIISAWCHVVCGDDRRTCENAWETLTVSKEPVSFELRLNHAWDVRQEKRRKSNSEFAPPADDEEHNVWVLCSMYPEVDADGKLKEIVGCAIDISRLKWAERVERQRTVDALQAKHHLENFIDTFSHEMRNPLSAITHSADGLFSTAQRIFTTYPSKDHVPRERRELIDSVLEAAEDIIQCATHQRRIVDDVLTVSKLESNLLTIMPTEMQPESDLRHILRMFDGEVRAADVKVEFTVEPAYRALFVDWLVLDRARILQVFVNLLTNALRSTRFNCDSDRRISVKLTASIEEPAPESYGVSFIPASTNPGEPPIDPTTGQEWGLGETVYLIVTLHDSGRGLAPEEKELLFARLSGSTKSPRSHVQYGGNGLGLFISRRLTEMQGGAVGFASRDDAGGNTFAFYVRARRRQGSEHSLSSPPLTPPTVPLRHPTWSHKARESVHAGASEISPGLAEIGDVAQLIRRPSNSNIHVLLVEDNLVNQRVLAKQLRKLGCEVNVANHGVEALRHLRATKFWTAAEESGPGSDEREQDSASKIAAMSMKSAPNPTDLSVVLMDWEMPVMDGITCVKKIREMQGLGELSGHVPVIAVTANARGEQLDMALEAGMVGYFLLFSGTEVYGFFRQDDVITKPFRMPDLMARIKGLLDKIATR
ncbi:hypothetical protein EJ06DRAFT_553429 [Trichodelitschia bisporula]|uniref:Uncharacterized protein n=1 Tax=Trichodelitschia bisporula TaxID=703511 RepID=A0A6G1I9B3_9PEZI|nr:hypothetical protein EJ06DRAFT_553429 [Trichodelitschia bisporula]